MTASRLVIYAYRSEASPEDDWRAAIGQAAAHLRQEVWSASGW
ncbi:MAG: hypothetical protein R3C15_08100 [Thermoleophilia bacterium]